MSMVAEDPPAELSDVRRDDLGPSLFVTTGEVTSDNFMTTIFTAVPQDHLS
jgi:hypothetical protein